MSKSNACRYIFPCFRLHTDFLTPATDLFLDIVQQYRRYSNVFYAFNVSYCINIYDINFCIILGVCINNQNL